MSVKGPSRAHHSMLHAATKEANRRIQQAEKLAKEAGRSGEAKVERLKQHYQKEAIRTELKHEENMEKQKLKGYEHLSAMARKQKEAIANQRRTAEREINQLKNHYDDQKLNLKLQSEKELKSIENQRKLSLAHEKRKTEHDLALQTSLNDLKQTSLQSQQQKRLHETKKAHDTEFNRLKDNYVQSNQLAKENFDQKYQNLTKLQTQTLSKMNENIAKRIKDIRDESAVQLTAYSNRQNDPFYKMVKINGVLEESDQSYRLQATIPSYEQDQVSVSVHADQIIVSGKRRNEERLETEDGRQITTNSYQSYSETFPLDLPVDARGLSKRFDGDQLIVEVPKAGQHAPPLPFKAVSREIEIHDPVYPKNIV